MNMLYRNSLDSLCEPLHTDSSDIGSEPLPNITFLEGSRSGDVQCVTVTIVGDEIVENNERFNLQFVEINGLDEFLDFNTEITIIDDDG